MNRVATIKRLNRMSNITKDIESLYMMKSWKITIIGHKRLYLSVNSVTVCAQSRRPLCQHRVAD